MTGGRAMYLSGGGTSVLALLNAPSQPARTGTGVLICPPFGWDEICSYRSRRAWAEQLAQSGHAVLRVDLPGTGDSAGSARDKDLAEAWVDCLAGAAAWLRESGACERVAAVGIGLGGLLLCAAVARDAPVEDIALWGTPGRGRAFLRELRAFGSLEEGSETAASEEEDGSIWAGGFLISGQTAAQLGALSVEDLDLSGRLRHALLLGRDGIAPDPRLRAALERAGCGLQEGPGEGWGNMTSKPHLARAPREVFRQFSDWLRACEEQPQSAPRTRTAAAPAWSEESRLELDGGSVRERPYEVPWGEGRLFGVLAEPARSADPGLCVVLLNAGAIRHVGPNRMWVEAARRWCAGHELPVLRIDLEGIGDSDGDGERFRDMAELYAPALVTQVRRTLDSLQADGIGDRFLMGGLCSGACWSFLAALEDDRVHAAMMLNPRALFWDPTLEAARDYRRGALRVSSWRKAITSGDVTPSRVLALARELPVAIPRRALARRRARRGEGDRLDLAFDALRDEGKHLHFHFSGGEPLLEELEIEGRIEAMPRWPNITIGHLPGAVHTLRPPEAQRAAHAALDSCIAVELEREGALAG